MTPSSEKDQQRTALLVSTLASFMTPFMGSSVNIALPTIGKEFSMDAVLLSWVITAYVLAAAVFLVPFSRIADIKGRKKVFAIGILVQSMGSLLSALAPSGRVLLAARGLQGMGSSMIFGTGVAILTSVFPAGKRGWALGFNVGAVYLGLSSGPIIGGFLTQYFSWRAVFFLPFPIGVAVLALVFWKLEGEWAEAKGESFDWMGGIVYGLTLLALMLGLSRLAVASGVWLIAAGVAGLCIFIACERRTAHPLLDMQLFLGNRVFAFSNLAALIHYCSTSSVGFLLSLYLQYIKGFSPRDAGLVMVCQPIMMASFSPLAGRLSDRIEPRVVASIGMGLTCVGIGMLTALGGETATAYIISCLILQGFGFALFSSPNTNAVMGSVERRRYGVASGTLGTMRLVGMMLSMGFVMLVFTWIIGRVEITPEHYPQFVRAMRLVLSMAAIFCVGGVIASLARGKTRREVAPTVHEAPAA